MARLFGEGAEHGTRGACAPRSNACERVDRTVVAAATSMLKNNVGEAEIYLGSPGGADDLLQFVRAFQRLRIGFV